MTSSSYRTSLQAIHALLEQRLPKNNVRIYEAGGGSASFIQLNFLENSNITVVDIDETQLKNNNYADHKVLGDIQTYGFPINSFDLIVCYNVIEHLPTPDQAIRLFSQCLNPGGLLVIGAPNPKSLSGWITRLTPHWFHVWYYRFILGHKDAGQPGAVPFRTIYHPIVAPAALISFCKTLGFQVIYFHEYEGDQYERIQQRRPFVGAALKAAVAIANALTLWKKDLKKGDYHLVLEKPNGFRSSKSPSGNMLNRVNRL